MALSRVTSPEGEIITRAQAKQYARIDTDDDDALVDELIVAARESIEGPDGGLNRVWLMSTWDLVLDRFPAAEILLPLAPVLGVTEITYYDEDGILQVLDPSAYYADTYSTPPWILPTDGAAWPATLGAANAMRVRFVAGYPEGTESESGSSVLSANVPAPVKLAVRMLVAYWYEHRDLFVEGAISELPEMVKARLQRFKIFLP